MTTRKAIGRVLFGRQDEIAFADLEPCPSPPNDNGFCGSQSDIYDRTGKYCEAKKDSVPHAIAAEICAKKQGMLR